MTNLDCLNASVSFYKDVKDMFGKPIYLQDIFHGIQTGAYKKQVEKIRALYPADLSDKEAKKRYQEAKRALPNFTISGNFTKCENDKLGKFSGFIGLDFDNLEDVDTAISELACDNYTVALFKSVSGLGLCLIVRVEQGRFLDAFEALEKYYLERYGYAVDPSGKNIARRRYVSYDDRARICNPEAPIFKGYLPKKAKKPEKPFFYVNSRDDIEHVFKQIEDKAVDIAPNYEDWYQLGYAFLAEFGDNGEQYFQRASQYHPDYHPDKVAKKWAMLCRQKSRTITIAKFFSLAKKAGLDLVSERTKEIAKIATLQKKTGVKKESVISTLQSMDGISPEESRPIVDAVFESKAEIEDDNDSAIGKIDMFVKRNYNLCYNLVTRRNENDGEEVDDRFESTLYLKIKQAFGKEITVTDVNKYLESDYIPTHNPLIRFFEKNKHMRPTGAIEALCNTITPVLNDYAKANVPNFVKYYFTRWLIGVVASAHGKDENPLYFILVGKMNTGKTQFWRNLMPQELENYYVESKMNDGKDDKMLMYSKLIIMTDEFGGDADAKMLKNLSSKSKISMRKYYGKHIESVKRLASFAGTSNLLEVINDPTGNRRIIAVNVDSINLDALKKIDKTEVFMEAYHLWKDGYSQHLNKEEIMQLNLCSTEFEEVSLERELIQKYFRPAEALDNGSIIEFLSATEVKIAIEKDSGQKLTSLNRIGQELKAMGYEQQVKAVNGTAKRGYKVVRV